MNELELLLDDTEAAIHLGITKELLYAYVRNAPKKSINHNRKLISIEVGGKNMFKVEDLDSFDDYLKEPWSDEGEKRAEIPSYIQEYLKTEIDGRCPITGKGYPLENAHIGDYSVYRNHHHHNIIRIAKDEHGKYDSGVLSKKTLLDTKRKLVDALRIRMKSSLKQTKIITYLPNIDIEVIKGRTNDIDKIKNLLTTEKTLIINGAGGIGKTSLVRLYSKLHFSEYDYLLWIDFPDNQQNSLGRDIFMSGIAYNFHILKFFGLPIENKLPLQNIFELILKEIIQLSGRKLLVFDNIPAAMVEFSDIIPKTSDLHILGTSRSILEEFKTYNLNTLEADAAISLFYSYYKVDRNDFLVTSILKLIGFHTLAIELLSKLAEKRGLCLESLNNLISVEGINISIEAKVTSSHDKSKNPTVPFIYLCNIFDITMLPVEQKNLLCNLAVIGDTQLSFAQLESIFKGLYESNQLFHSISDLHQLGWITKIDNRFYVHQLISEVLRFKLDPDFKKCQDLINNIFTFIEKSSNEYNIYSQKPYIKIAENIVSFISLQKNIANNFKSLIARHHGFFGNIEKYNKWYDSLQFDDIKNEEEKIIILNHGNILLSQAKFKEAIDIFQRSKKFIKDELSILQIDGSIGHAYGELGKYQMANDYFEPAYEKLKNNSDITESEYAVFINNYSMVLNGLGNTKKALELDLKVLEIREKLLDNMHPLLAQSYNNIGVSYEYLRQCDKAYFFHTKALEIRSKFEISENRDLAESFHNIASVYFQKNEIQLAIEYFQKAMKIREDIFKDGSPALINTYCCLASVMLGRDSDNAIELYEKAFSYYDKFELEANENTPFWIFGFITALVNNKEYDKAMSLINLSLKLSPKNKNASFILSSIQAIKTKIFKELSIDEPTLPSRNELCHCGSGKKYKKCCETIRRRN